MLKISRVHLVIFIGLITISTMATAHSSHQGLFRRDNLTRIGHLGALPGADTNRYLLQGVDEALQDSIRLQKAAPLPELQFAVEAYRALAEYGQIVEPIQNLDEPRPSELAAITRAAFAARLHIMRAAAQGLKNPIGDWSTYFTLVHAFLQTQSFAHTPASPAMVKALQNELADWPRLFKAILESATDEMQFYLIKEVYRLSFVPPDHVFGTEARRAITQAYYSGRLAPTVRTKLEQEFVKRLWMAEHQNVLYSDMGELLNEDLSLNPLTRAQKETWVRQSKAVLPGGIDKYLQTEVQSLSELVNAFKGLKAPRSPDLKAKVSTDSVQRQLIFHAVDADSALVKSYEHLKILVMGILSGNTPKQLQSYESWLLLISTLEFGFRSSLIHPAFSEFQLKFLVDFIRVGREHFPMSLEDSLSLLPLFRHAVFHKSSHPAISELAYHVIDEPVSFAAEVQILALQYLLVRAETQARPSLELQLSKIIQRFPSIAPKRGNFPGAPVSWWAGDHDIGQSLSSPYLEVWLRQKGLEGADLLDCEALLL